MPHTNLWEDRGVIRHFTGCVTGEEIINSNLKMHGDARFDDLAYIINDLIDVEECVITEDELVMLSVTDAVAEHSNKFLKIAIVATNMSIIDLANSYCEFMTDNTYATQVFNDMNDAFDWINDK